MSYSIYWYAMNGEAFAERLSNAPDILLAEVRQRILEKRKYEQYDVTELLDAAKRICTGDLPDDCDGGYFNALSWIASVAAEVVPIASFESLRYGSGYLEAVGIWPWMRKHPPPFPVPRSKQTPPEVGYLSVEAIRGFALPAFETLPTTDDAGVRHGRNEFKEVLESLVDDNLDLLGVLI